MEQIPILAQYEQLPENYKKEARDFIDFLFSKVKFESKKIHAGKRNAFGCLKGQIKMSDDFDEPLEDFKEYM